MIEHVPKEEILSIIKEIEVNPSTSQRNLSERLGISLGKTNYLLKELVKKGIVKAKNFSNHPGKLTKINYLLTNKGFEKKIELMHHFLKRKEAEYTLLKQEWDKLKRPQK